MRRSMLAPITLSDNCYLISSTLVSDKLNLQSFNTRPTCQPDNRVGRTLNNLTSAGRGQVSRVTIGSEQGVLRHYYRGGLMANLSDDKFLWTGINRTRAVSEYRLLEWMTTKDLPVPFPLGARVIRNGLYYTCDLITREVPDTRTLAQKLQLDEIDLSHWRAVGKAIRQLHMHNVFHADLNANNILLNDVDTVTIIDFDKCRQRKGYSWKQMNINRLKRSLDKLTAGKIVKYFNAHSWQALLEAYKR